MARYNFKIQAELNATILQNAGKIENVHVLWEG